jgi:predicted DNA-binding protein
MKTDIEHKSKRRTKAEIELAEKLDALAKVTGRKAPDAAKVARAKKLSAAAKKSPRFEGSRGYSSIDQLPIHYFHRRGETITGVLGEHQQEIFMACTYPVKLDTGRVVRIVAHRRLRQLVETGKYIGRKVTITYEGKMDTWGGHHEKVYSIDIIDEEGERLEALKEAAKNADSRKVLQEQAAAGNEFAKKMLAKKARKGGK